MNPNPESAVKTRLRGLRKAALSGRSAPDALLVTNLQNIRYLSGFTGTTAMMLVLPGESLFFSDFRYRGQAAKEVKGSRFVEVERDYLSNVAEVARKKKVKTLGVEAGHMTLATLDSLKKLMRGAGVRFVPVAGAVEGLRLLKDAGEIAVLRQAHKIACAALDDLVPRIRPGASENDLAAELEFLMRRHGGEGISFTTIVGSGLRSAQPHCVASDKKVKKGEFVVVDFGTLHEGYHSDTTRTFHVGKPSSEARKIYQTVLDAQNRAIERVRLGMPMRDVDAISREHIKKAGYGKFFGHGLGHGVGLDIHERPTVSPKGKESVASNMVFTIEPGIYVPSLGGVRIEDVIWLDAKGRAENITKYPKALRAL